MAYYKSNPPLSKATLSHAIHRSYFIISFAVVLAVTYRYCWLGELIRWLGIGSRHSLMKAYTSDAHDPYKCKALLHQGRWLDSARGPFHEQPFQNWQPPGCLMHDYTSEDIGRCLKTRSALFVGDSTIRQIFWAIARKVDRGAADKAMGLADKHGELSFRGAGLEMNFIWDPFLNSTRLHEELTAYRDLAAIPKSDATSDEDSPALILIGGGLWHARHIDNSPVDVFKKAVDKIMPFVRPNLSQAADTNSHVARSHQMTGNCLLLAPVQVPLYEKLSPSRAASITPEKVEGMNEYLRQLSATQGVNVLWSYSRMVWQEKLAYEESGLHVVEHVANREADVLLNLRCNTDAVASGAYPLDRTCCAKYRSLGWVQYVILLFGLGLGLLPVAIAGRGESVQGTFEQDMTENMNAGRVIAPVLPSSQHSYALLAFFSAVCYCFIADRTHFFNKSQKDYSQNEFIAFSMITLLLGVISMRRSARPTGPGGDQRAHPITLDQPLLSRHQTDEWKGWMQFIILIYHYTGASKVLRIYQIIRLLVASYLFMTGFGHTIYFYKKDDFSGQRVTSVLVRLNLLSCVLTYVMRTDYLFYYFAPLVSFWVVVIYWTMKVGHTHNRNVYFLLGKIAVSAILVNISIRVPGILEAVFLVLKKLCRIHWNVTEWRFRILLDIFIVHVGMVFGVLFVIVSAASSSEQRHPNMLFSSLQHYYYYIRFLSVVLALTTFPGFWWFAGHSADKLDYNRWQPFISSLPVLSFIILRNTNRQLRNFHSLVFAWLGRCSLETFTLQYHIWLAGDTKGLLSIGVFDTSRSGRLKDFVLHDNDSTMSSLAGPSREAKHQEVGSIARGRWKAHQPLSSPPSRKLQSPFSTQSHPPRTPLPFLQSVFGMESPLPGSHFSRRFCSSLGGTERLTNLDKPQVNGLKSSSSGLSGICPVRTRPMAIREAACVHSSTAFGFDSSASRSATIRDIAYAQRSWS